MRILILTQWYPPEPAVLLQELAQSLQARGHDVTVLTGFPNYPSGQLYPGYSLRLRLRETLAGVPIVRVPLYPEHSHSGLHRAFNYLSFALASAVLGPWSVSKPDIIFVYHPPLTIGIPAWLLGMLWRAPFVYQIQDMWPETLRATGMLNSPHALSLIGQFAKFVYARARELLVISPGFRKNLLMKGVPADKIHVVSNWVELGEGPIEPDPKMAIELGVAGHFNIMFAGNMGEAQGLETVLEAAFLLQDLPDVQFVMVGDGIALPNLMRSVQELGVSNVRFLGRYPQQAMPGLYALADVLLVHLKRDPLFEITIPHKVLTYLGAGKPILAAVEGDAAAVVVDNAAGIACQPGNAVALANAVRHFYAMDPIERQAMGKRSLRVATEQFTREGLVGEIEQILQQACNRHGGGRDVS